MPTRPDSTGSHRSVPNRWGTRRGLAAAGLLAGVLVASTVGWLPGSAAGSPGSPDAAKVALARAAVPDSDIGPAPAPPSEPPPAFAADLPAETAQVVRTIRTDQWCAKVYCTRTEAWEKTLRGWRIATKADGRPAVFRSTIGPKGFAAPGMRREDDGKSPSGVYAITVTFSTTETAPGPMPWRPRLPTSVVSGEHDKNYNTWVESKGLSNGDRPSMRYGFWMDYNNPRLTPGVGAEARRGCRERDFLPHLVARAGMGADDRLRRARQPRRHGVGRRVARPRRHPPGGRQHLKPHRGRVHGRLAA